MKTLFKLLIPLVAVCGLFAPKVASAQQICFPCQFTNATLITPSITGTVTMSGTFGTYNSNVLVNSGICSEIAQISLTAQTANIGSTNITSSTLPTGMYYLIGQLKLTTAAGTSSTTPSLVIGWTDVAALSVTTAPTGTTNTTNMFLAVMQGMHISAATNVTYQTTGYVSNPGAAMQYSLYLTLLVC